MPRITRLLVIAASLALLGSACSSDDSASKESTTEGSGAVTSVEDAKDAVVQVLAEGEFRDPEVGTVAGAGSGSGFIISPDGLVVTNNHVVAGAGSVKVLVGGNDEEIPAQVVGVSECNDLALIQLDDSGPWPYLDFADTAPEPPLEVFALGYPLGDPEYTATSGVVSKAKADGETNWASVESVIEHDANIQPGNSGGPLVNGDGQVVGVNYSSYTNDATTTQQFFAINAELASDVVDALRDGDDLSIGVNGTAVLDEESGVAGVWVNGLTAGGAAKKAGLEPGDVITNLNGVQLDSGTLEEYCDVLRSATEGEALSIRVLRFDTSEELEGELYGDELTTSYSFATELGGQVSGGGEDITADDYVAVEDDTGRIATEVPAQWSDLQTQPQDLAGLGSDQPTLVAAPSIDAFNSDAGPGVVVVAIDGIDPTADNLTTALDGFVGGSGCAESSRDDYDDGLLSGPFAVLDCDSLVGVALSAATTENPNTLVLFIGLAATEADLAVLDQVVASLVVA